MFRRSNKITALLVAAASVMTMVPAMAADNTRVGDKSGTVKQGIAYDNGAYAYYGYRDSSTDDTGIYFNKGGEAKDTANSDLSDYRFNSDSKYGTKYAYAKENSNDDEYLVDLSTGQVVADETAEEKLDTARSKAVTNIKKADRYNNIITTINDLDGDGQFEQILKGQFGEVWYQYNKTVDGAAANTSYKAGYTTTMSVAIPQVAVAKSAAQLQQAVNDALAAQDVATKAEVKTAATLATAAADPAKTVAAPANKTAAQAALVTEKAVSPATAASTANIAYLNAFIAEADAQTAVTTANAAVTTANNAQTANNTNVAAANTAVGINQVSDNNYTVTVNGNAVTFVATGSVVNGISTPTQANVDAAVLNYVKGLASVKAVFGTNVSVSGTNVVATVSNTSASVTAAQTAAITTDLGVTFSAANTNVVGYTGNAQGGSTLYTGFVNEDGKYIDCSENANLRIYSDTKGRAVTVDKYDDTVNDAGLAVHLNSLNAVAQDTDYIYAIADVTVSGEGLGTAPAQQYFLQKISKAQGDKGDGKEYTPKSITSYQLQDPSSQIYDDSDMNDAWDALHGTKDADYSDYLLGMKVVDGSLYVTRAIKNSDGTSDKVKVYKLDMKNIKKDVVIGGATLKTDVDTYAVTYDDGQDTDIVSADLKDSAEDEGIQGIELVKDITDETKTVQLDGMDVYRHPAVSIDTTGSTWALDKGQVKKYTKLDVKDVNTCDRGMSAIDAYNDTNYIVWDISGDAYSTPAEGSKVTEADGINVNPDINKDKFKNGYDTTDKKFYKDGQVVTNAWASDNGKWYLLDANGAALTGWQQKGAWYLLGADGAMLTGWQQNGGNWYYLNPVNSAGNMVTGWFQDTTGTWYYADASGKMLSNTTVDGYTLSASGAWVK